MTAPPSRNVRVDLLLAQAYDPDPRIRRTAEALSAAGYDVRVLAWDRSGKRPVEERDGIVRVRRVRVKSRPSRGWTQVFFLALVAVRLLPIVRRTPPDVIHAANLPMLAVALALAPFVGRPRIIYDAFEIHALMGAQRYPDWLTWIIGRIERYLPKAADLVITPGEDRQRYFASLGVSSVPIPNWIDPKDTGSQRVDARERLGIEQDRFVILYAGGIIGSRDLQPLIDHAAACPDDVVLIAGQGDMEEELARSAAGLPNVRLLGWVGDPRDLLAATDVLYYALKPDHPYAAHAAPNNLYQAIAHAIPLVYREQGEIALIASRHRIGASFVDRPTLEAAFDALRDSAENTAVREELRRIQDQYRWSRAAELLVETYGRLGLGRSEDDRAAEAGPAPLLVLTRIWPSRERPSVGSFVQARVAGVTGVRVVRPRWSNLPRILLYLILLLDSLRVRGPLRGIEAHMLIPTGFVGLLAALMRRVPLVVYSHGGDVREWRQLALPLRWISRLVARHADAVVTNSEDTARYLRELGRDPIVIPPGVDLSRFVPTPRPTERRVLYLGGRSARKGYDIAVELADTLVGPWLRDLDPSEVPALIAAHDVVLMPSRAEPFGLVAVEAIASGRWVIASDVGGLRDIVIDGENGFLVRDGDYRSALERVPDYDPYAIARTVDRFSLVRWQEEMERVWADLDGGPPSTAAHAGRSRSAST